MKIFKIAFRKNKLIRLMCIGLMVIFFIMTTLVNSSKMEMELEIKNDSTQANQSTSKPPERLGYKATPLLAITGSDKELDKIRDEVYKLAQDRNKSSNSLKRAKGYGNLPGFYNKYARFRGQDSRKKKILWGFMNDVVQIYEFCINPFYSINYVKWCNNSFLGNGTKNDGKFITL